ncbi:MAG: hypothetical protein J6I71_01415 [Campylobacter sp.]|uniref:hypothetical protein n=1 Tax=Campylobacter sp. TaxID=205 RepID=UPI001B6B020F|nr:hypothetical protein [Campylobacter sp.]MBP3675111.1 hypothetical protein [Campylobacter sp.]
MSLIQRLIKHKITKSKDKQKLIDEMIATLGASTKSELKELLEELYMVIMDNYDSDELQSIIQNRLERLDIHIKDMSYEDLYRSFLIGVGGRSDLRFDSVDARAIKVMRDNFYWMKGEFNAKVSDELKQITKEIFEGKIPRIEAGKIMRERFKGVLSANTSYFEGVSDHIISQMQNVSVINEGAKNGVEYYKVVARIDGRTSECCRSMNGRIIPASHLETQSQNIQNAKNIAQKKAAAIWRNGAFYGKILPKDFGLPPYHFRCRTEVVPVWIDEEVIDGVAMKNTSPLTKDEVIKHIDKTGVERVLDKKAAYGEHGLKDRLNRDKNLKKDIISALNSITKTAPKKGEENLINAISQNGYYMVFDGNRLVTAYKRENLERYFNKNSVTLKQEIIKRWWQK